MNTKHRTFAALSAAAILTPGLVAPTVSFSARHLTKATAAVYAGRDARAAVVINGGDKVRVTGCHAVGRGKFRCQIEVIPVNSSSRCHFTDTIGLLHGKPMITYSRAACSN